MPLNLVDLPQDVLDHFFERLLPPLHPSLPLYRNSMPTPVDLHKLMLVCRRLHNLALPWAWRRLAIEICVLEQYMDEEHRFHFENHDDPRLRNPTHFAHVRVFVLTIYHIGGEPNDPSPVLNTLKSCVSLMENLQVLVFNADGARPALVGDIFASLISKPRLHTLVTSNHTPAVHSSLTNLRRLRVNETSEWLRVAPCLESLSIGNSRDVLTSPIPWDTLREIHVSGHRVVDAIIKGFSTWKQTFPDTVSPLKEILIDTKDAYESLPGVLNRVFREFRTQEIHTLSLIELPSVDSELLDRIAEAFPGLSSLTLTAYISTTWSLSGLDVALGRLPTLRKLRWNFRDEVLYDKGPSANLDHDDIGPQRFIPSLASHCKALECVTFFNWFVRDRTYSIHRDEKGRYAGCELVNEESYTDSFATSGWNPTSHAWII